MPEIKFESPWISAGEDVKEGDIITFVDAGKLQKNKKSGKDQWVFTVRVQRTQAEKFFSLNKTNFKKVSGLHGTNSDNWVGKEMKVHLVMVESPSTGEEVPGIRLRDPLMEVLGDDDDERGEEESEVIDP